jgi:excisionase family DNA binding protein
LLNISGGMRFAACSFCFNPPLLEPLHILFTGFILYPIAGLRKRVKNFTYDKDFHVTVRAVQKEADELLSTAEVAAQLGVTRQRVLELITDERLPARKVGRSYVVRASDLSLLARFKVGRPSKASKKKGG